MHDTERMIGARIAGIASYLPANKVSNHDLFVKYILGYDANAVREKNNLHDLKDWEVFDWQTKSLTGIVNRHYIDADHGETTESMMVSVAKEAIHRAGISPQDVDLVLAPTSSAFNSIPNAAVYVANEIGASAKPGIRLDTACSGFHYAMATAQWAIKSGWYHNILIVNGETLSKMFSFREHNTRMLLGDGAAATVVQPTDQGGVSGQFYLGSDYSLDDLVKKEIGQYLSHHMTVEVDGKNIEVVERDYMHMNGGGNVLKRAIRSMTGAGIAALVYEKYGKKYHDTHRQFFDSALTKKDLMYEPMPGQSDSIKNLLDSVQVIIPHQANQRIITGTAEKLLDKKMHKTISIIKDTGNISGVTTPLALEMLLAGKVPQSVRAGDRILFIGVGGGYTIGAFVYTHV